MKTTYGNSSILKRGRTTSDEWQHRARYVLRHLDDPLALEWSPLCRLPVLERMAKEKYPNSVLPRGRALHDFISECLQEIENELNGHAGVSKLEQFISLIRQGIGVAEASRSLGVTPSYASRTFKRTLVDLLVDKLVIRLRTD
jgi:hypothetical protein